MSGARGCARSSSPSRFASASRTRYGARMSVERRARRGGGRHSLVARPARRGRGFGRPARRRAGRGAAAARAGNPRLRHRRSARLRAAAGWSPLVDIADVATMGLVEVAEPRGASGAATAMLRRGSYRAAATTSGADRLSRVQSGARRRSPSGAGVPVFYYIEPAGLGVAARARPQDRAPRRPARASSSRSSPPLCETPPKVAFVGHPLLDGCARRATERRRSRAHGLDPAKRPVRASARQPAEGDASSCCRHGGRGRAARQARALAVRDRCSRRHVAQRSRSR